MIRLLLCLAVTCFVALPMVAQDERLEDLNFDEEPIKEESAPYFAVGVGTVANFTFLNVDDVNLRSSALGLDNLSSPMIQAGVELFTAVGLVENLRVGFSWVTGSLSTTKDITDTLQTNSSSFNRTLEYSVGSRAVFIDYAIVPAKSLAILPGVGFGWSTQTISTYQAPANEVYNVNGGINTPSAEFSELSRSVLSVIPRINIEYAVSPFLNLRLNAAYTVQFSSGDWQGNRTSTVTGVPDAINVNGLNAQLGLFLGLFN